ncbi:glutathione S-transferase family protein [Archangium lipolyticum]|uniref:glutathione S-transferase family protein n=1 Tax=Archangium lipolyticum TaxID=2970465 RepID=UPI00214A2A6A|nr:glutathione S-transferase family protein [Archangium lipolyticum]
MLLDGEWRTDWYAPDEAGRFVRPRTRFHDRVSASGEGRFPAEAGRYHLYVSYACPWASRTLIIRKLKGLDGAVGVTVADPRMGRDGWRFGGCYPRANEDKLNGTHFLRELYQRADPHYSGRVTVPILWDARERTIVNNESRELLRMLDTEFDAFAEHPVTLWPEGLRDQVDATIDALYEPVNNGVYKAGFATSQGAYELACRELFSALEHWEGVLDRQRYLCGEVLTEADICFYTTLVRFDLVYYSHFKCNLSRLQDYPNLWNYLLDLYQTPGFAETTNVDHIKVHYYWSQDTVNPSRIIPMGPAVDLLAPHNRDRLGPRMLAPAPGITRH